MQVTLAEAVPGVFAGQDGGKERGIGGRHRLEAGMALAGAGMGLAQAVQLGERFACGLGQG